MTGRSSRYEKIRQLGAGSLGPIFEARDRSLDRPVVIRELSQRLVDEPARARRVIERVEKLAAISHPHVLTVHAVEARHHPPRFVVELLGGKTVADLLAEGPVAPERVAVLLGQALEGLQQLHHHSIIHGDLRPSQLFLQREMLKLGDFGLTALGSRQERNPESVRYSAPEVLSGTTLPSAASDLFALGLVAYQLTLGTERFLRVVVDRLEGMKVKLSSSESDKLWRKLHTSSTELPPLREVDPSIPKQFSDLVSSLIRKDPSQRPEGCGPALRKLSSMRGWTTIFEAMNQPGARAEGPDDPFDDLLRRLSPQRVGLAVAVLVVLAVIVFGLRRAGVKPAAPSRPEILLESPSELLSSLQELVASRPAASLRLAGKREMLAIGESLKFEVVTPRDAYAALFVVSDDGTLVCLYPNRRIPHLRLEANRPKILPSLEDNLLGLALKADLPVGEDDAFLLTSKEVFTRPPEGQGLVGEWMLAFPFTAGPENPAARFLGWIERSLSSSDTELVHLRYRVTAKSED